MESVSGDESGRLVKKLSEDFWLKAAICGFHFCWIWFGCGEVFGGGWASGPWISDGGGGGFFPQTGSGLMDFVAAFVTEGSQFCWDDGLELVAVILMWNSFQALESKLEGTEACV